MSRLRRQSQIARILRRQAVTSQEELCDLLRDEGIAATQATVSRDLAALGALRGPDGYALPGETVPVAAGPSDELHSAMKRHALSVKQAATLVVVRTAPGHAAVVGAALDRRPPVGVVGTVAGDDTILIATTGQSAARRLVRQLAEMLHSREDAA